MRNKGISIIVAFDEDHGIGASGDLLWARDMPADLRHFKKLTTGYPIIMGRKTYESIGRPLPDRLNIVVTHQDILIPGIIVVHSLEDAYKEALSPDVFVIGGGQMYDQAIQHADMIFATKINASFHADTYFPPIAPDQWSEVEREHHEKDALNTYDYDFITYVRR